MTRPPDAVPDDVVQGRVVEAHGLVRARSADGHSGSDVDQHQAGSPNADQGRQRDSNRRSKPGHSRSGTRRNGKNPASALCRSSGLLPPISCGPGTGTLSRSSGPARMHFGSRRVAVAPGKVLKACAKSNAAVQYTSPVQRESVLNGSTTGWPRKRGLHRPRSCWQACPADSSHMDVAAGVLQVVGQFEIRGFFRSNSRSRELLR